MEFMAQVALTQIVAGIEGLIPLAILSTFFWSSILSFNWSNMDFLISNAYAQAAPTQANPGIEGIIFPLAILVILAIFFLGTNKRKAGGENMWLANRNIGADDQAAVLATLFTPRNETNTFSTAQVLRDEACTRLVQKAKSTGFEIIEQRSQAHSPGVWFRVDYLVTGPNPELSLRMSVAVNIERFDFHRFEHTFTVTVDIGGRVKKVSGLISLDDSDIDSIHDYLINPNRKLRLRNRIRKWPWQLWLPRNKVQQIRRDWTSISLILLAIALVFVPFGILMTISILFWLYLRAQQRRTYVLTSGRPHTDPRSLLWMDSWQTSIGGLGMLAPATKEGIMTRLRKNGPADASVAVERIGYWGTDRWVERDQIVIIHRRAIGYIHVVPYGGVLYVAWESHLNSASWVEQTLAQGIDRVSGLHVVANRVVAGSFRLNEYDLSDSNFLAEWLHEAVKDEVKLRMAEYQIDQEIDFTVQRESRKNALGASGQATPSDEISRTDRFKRLI